jgi:hypothetical protein
MRTWYKETIGAKRLLRQSSALFPKSQPRIQISTTKLFPTPGVIPEISPQSTAMGACFQSRKTFAPLCAICVEIFALLRSGLTKYASIRKMRLSGASKYSTCPSIISYYKSPLIRKTPMQTSLHFTFGRD